VSGYGVGLLAGYEIGNEAEEVFDKNGNALPRVDPHTDSYRPGARAMNYRSEPFMDRLNVAPEQESLAYASYTFADPSTVTPHSYQRDPMKFRLIHAGSEVFHVFHLHGGGIRWRYNPKADPSYTYGDTGLNKKPVVYSQSQRLDSQAFGPGESYNLEIEGGSGGVQQGAGEFLFHCHVVKHYVSGMWGFWRVFNTLQPDLAPLPDRATASADLTNNMREVPAPVTSDQLIGRTFNQFDANGNITNAVTLTANNLKDWIEPQLPPQGKRTGFEDAQIWDWTRDPDVFRQPNVESVAAQSVTKPDVLNFDHYNARLTWAVQLPTLPHYWASYRLFGIATRVHTDQEVTEHRDAARAAIEAVAPGGADLWDPHEYKGDIVVLAYDPWPTDWHRKS